MQTLGCASLPHPQPLPDGEGSYLGNSAKQGCTSAAITGQLTLNGVTRPVTIAARFTGAGKGLLGSALNVGFEGTARIKRSDFGLVADFPLVGDPVDLTISATFVHR